MKKNAAIRYHEREEFGFVRHQIWFKDESQHCRICGMSLFEMIMRGDYD